MNDIKRGNRPGIGQASLLFSIVIFLFVFIGYRVQEREFYSGVLITEFVLIMLPAILLLFLYKYDLKSVLRLNAIKPLNLLIIFVIMLVAIPLVGIFNMLNLLLVDSIFGTAIIPQLPIANNTCELLLNMVVIAGSAGICEEVLFRGVIQRSFEKFGAMKAILLTSLLFSLTHMDFQKIFGTFLLGALIGFFVYRTNSLFSGIFAHFANNGIAVLLTYVSYKLTSVFQETGAGVEQGTDINSLFSAFEVIPPEQLIIVVFIYGAFFLFIAAVFILLMYAFCKLNPVDRYIGDVEITGVRKKSKEKRGLLLLLPGLALIVIVYFLQASSLAGVENSFIDAARNLLF